MHKICAKVPILTSPLTLLVIILLVLQTATDTFCPLLSPSSYSLSPFPPPNASLLFPLFTFTFAFQFLNFPFNSPCCTAHLMSTLPITQLLPSHLPSAVLTPPHSSHLQHSLHLSQKLVTFGGPRCPPWTCWKLWGWASLPPAPRCQVFPLHHPKTSKTKKGI